MKKNNSVMDFCKICIHENEIEQLIPTEEDDKTIKKKGIVNKLCENNVISTQSILIKTEIAKMYQFDPMIPNTDDYDLALRVAIDHKVSYTNEPLVDLYRQNDSITYSVDKLRKSCISMLKKNYNLSEEQYKIFYNNLLFQASKNKYQEYWDEILENRNQIEKLNNEICEYKNSSKKMEESIINIKSENDKLKCDILKLEKENNKVTADYNKIINSKRWKIVNRICRIIKK